MRSSFSGPKLPTHVKNEPKSTARPFPLSPYAVLFSCIFWTLVFYLSFKGLQYFGVHRSLDDADITFKDEEICKFKFKDTVAENVAVVEKYKKGEAGPYLNRIGSQKFSDQFIGTEAPNDLPNIPPIVTAIRSENFFEVQGLLKQLVEDGVKKIPDLKIIVYDLGLYSRELELLKEHCSCEVRKFDASIYPDHVSYTENGAWRPIILQTILEEFGAVAYMDSAARLKNVNDLSMLKYRGSRDFFLWEYPVFTSIIAYTNPNMFQFLGEKRCPFMDSGMMDVRTLVLYRTNMTWNSIMKPWLKCALSIDCISPHGARKTECFHFKRPKTTGCHWYDQSAFSIIMSRVYQFTSHLDKYAVPRITTYDLETVYYFPVQPWTYSEMVMVTIMPLLCVGGLYYLIIWKRSRRAATKSFYKHR